MIDLRALIYLAILGLFSLAVLVVWLVGIGVAALW